MSRDEGDNAVGGPSDPPRRSVKLPRSADVPGGEMSYTDEGPVSAPVIIALHGLPGSSRDYRWLAPHLTPHFRVIRPEMPGFGATPVATEPDRSPEARARCTLSLIHTLNLRRPLVLGHSMGGVVATALVSEAPEICTGLALLSSPGVTPHALLKRSPFKLLSWLLYRPLIQVLMRPLVRASFHSLGFKRYPDHELYGAIHGVAATSMARHADRVRGLELPTLVAWCQDDPLIEEEILSELAQACPEGPRLPFATGGHNLQKSHAAEIAAALIEWQSRL